MDLPRLSGEKEFAEVDSNKEQGNKMSRRSKHQTDEFKAEAVELVERVRDSAERHSRLCLDTVALEVPDAYHRCRASSVPTVAADNCGTHQQL